MLVNLDCSMQVIWRAHVVAALSDHSVELLLQRCLSAYPWSIGLPEDGRQSVLSS